jgi:hypothetical protein
MYATIAAPQLSSVRPVAARFQAKRTPVAKRASVVTRAAAAPKEVRRPRSAEPPESSRRPRRGDSRCASRTITRHPTPHHLAAARGVELQLPLPNQFARRAEPQAAGPAAWDGSDSVDEMDP